MAEASGHDLPDMNAFPSRIGLRAREDGPGPLPQVTLNRPEMIFKEKRNPSRDPLL